MDNFIQFCLKYYRLLIDAFMVLIFIILVVINAVKRRPSTNVIDSIKEDVLELLPRLITLVENDGNGQLKKNAVIDLVKEYVKKNYPGFEFLLIDSWLKDMIECILSTPQKKG